MLAAEKEGGTGETGFGDNMPSLEGNLLHDPLGFVKLVFDRCQGTASGDFAEELQKQFKSRILNGDGVSWVPSLNDVPAHQLPVNCLVRYRGMIQDMFGPEIFLSRYELAETESGPAKDVCCGWYQDITDCPPGRVILMDSPNQVLAERQAFYCVPLPGETDWAKQTFASQSKAQERLDSSCTSNLQESPSKAGSRKRGRTEGDESCSTGEITMAADATGESAMHRDHVSAESEGADSKRLRSGSGTADNSVAAAVAGIQSVGDLNFPLPGERGPPCIVKVYDDIDSYRVNEMVEFIGVLSMDPSLTAATYTHSADEVGMDSDMAKEEAVHSPPPNIVPRLHCFSARRLLHSNPLLPANADDFKAATAEIVANSSSCREELCGQFAALLGGDQLSAEFLLLSLLSTVYARHDTSVIGKFSLNLSNVPRDVSTQLVGQLSTALQTIVPKFYSMPMSLEHLNNKSLCPKKDYAANRLVTGQLQLSDGTVVLLDETALSEGQLNERGIANIMAINSVLSRQHLAYDFQYQTVDFPTNINGIVVSEGKSILQTDCQVPVEIQADVPAANVLTATQLNMLRSYLTAVQRIDYDLPADVQKHLQDDFVAMRKDNPEGVNAETFHRLLLLSRLLSLSRGQRLLDVTTWNDAKKLETLRCARVASNPATAAATQ